MTEGRLVLLCSPSEPARTVELTKQHFVAMGGQGAVYSDANRTLAVKLYRKAPTEEVERRLHGMLLWKEDDFRTDGAAAHPVLAWPSAAVKDLESGKLIGYAMRWIGDPDYVPLGAMFSTSSRQEWFPPMAWRFPLGVARNLSGLFDALHQRQRVLGDVSDANLVVNRVGGFVTFLDCDSMPFIDPSSGEYFPCTVLTEDYSPPELQRHPTLERTAETDNFSLAVLVCQLLLMGDHPFMGRRSAHDSDELVIADNVRDGFSHLTRHGEMVLPQGTLGADLLPAPVLPLATQAFGPGHERPELRPTARVWFEALRSSDALLTECSRRTLHKYPNHLPACPWCARTNLGYPDLFPGGAEHRTRVAVRLLAAAILILLIAGVVAAALLAH